MSIIKIKKDDFDTFSIVTTPNRYYHSSSLGITGSVQVIARSSNRERTIGSTSAFLDSSLDDSNIDSFIENVKSVGKFLVLSPNNSYWSNSFHSMMGTYLDKVHAQSSPTKNKVALEIDRFTPTTRWTDNTVRKLQVKDILNKYYRVSYPTAQWAYTNYNCLNFFTGNNVINSSALLYPMTSGPIEHSGYTTGSYIPSGSFSFDFYINPRYNFTKPGTILHLSSTYAVSLLTGSQLNGRDLPETFSLMLQIGSSTGINPSLAADLTTFNYPNDLIFKSNPDVLKQNTWHHVIIRWGTNLINRGTGSFIVDGVEKGTFVIPSGTIAPLLPTSGNLGPNVLFIGNFFESDGYVNPINNDSNFFASSSCERDGLVTLMDSYDNEEPTSYKLEHPLNAELHDVSIKRYYMNSVDILVSASRAPTSLDTGHKGIAFYLPPFFTQESPFRKFVGDHGGILQTPFLEVDGVTDDPFNVALSFGVNGHYINLENFTRDFASNVSPRLHQLSGTTISYTTSARAANDFLYDDPMVRKRNLTIMPCDDGHFVPSYELLMSESSTAKYIDDLGNSDHSLIHLDNLLNENALLFGTEFQTINDDPSKSDLAVEQFVSEQIGFTPEQPGLQPGSAFVHYIRTIDNMVSSGTFDPGVQSGAPLTIYNRTKDASSNQVTFFSISNLFYGDRILPKSFSIKDPQLSGSNGNISITLKDDGYGNLYRADSLSNCATWNSVGNVYYNEGIIVIKSPHLYFFGKNEFEINFKGERKVHVLNVNCVADRNQINSSSNPNWMPVSASSSPVEQNQDFVYISGVNFHDENLNVIAKSSFAQPIMKKYASRLLFRTKIDF